MKEYMNRLMVSRRFQVVCIILLFIGLSLITIIRLKSHQIVGHGDFIYHFSRIEAFAEAIRSHQWFNFRNFSTFNQIGVANNYFYPYVYEWLWSILFVIISNPVWAYYAGVFFIMMTGLLVTYVSVWKLSQSRLTGLLVAIFFMTTPYHVFLLNSQSVLGEALAATFIPLFVLGGRELLVGPLNHWWLVAVALALTAYAHLITLALEMGLLLVLYLCLLVRTEERLTRFLNCLKAAGLFFGLTSFFWVPLIQFYLRAPIQTTTQLSKVLFLTDFGALINMMLTNGALSGITENPGLIALVAIGLFIIAWRKLPNEYRVIGLISIGLLLISTSLFPWYSLPHQIQNTIQFPYRLYGLTSFGLILVGVVSVVSLVNGKSERRPEWLIDLCTVLVSVAISVCLYSSLISQNYRVMSDETPYTARNAPKLSEAFNVRFKLDLQNYRTLFKSPRIFWGTIDYAPRLTWQGHNQESLIAHQVLNGRKRVKKTYSQNGNQIVYYFKLNRAAKIDIPVLHYGTERVLVNNRPVHAVTSQRGSTLIPARKGNNKVVISEPRPLLFMPLVGLSLLAWGIILVKGIRWGRQS